PKDESSPCSRGGCHGQENELPHQPRRLPGQSQIGPRHHLRRAPDCRGQGVLDRLPRLVSQRQNDHRRGRYSRFRADRSQSHHRRQQGSAQGRGRSRRRRSGLTIAKEDKPVSEPSSHTIEALLAQIEALPEGIKAFELFVPQELTWKGNPVAQNVAMAIVLDKLLAIHAAAPRDIAKERDRAGHKKRRGTWSQRRLALPHAGLISRLARKPCRPETQTSPRYLGPGSTTTAGLF